MRRPSSRTPRASRESTRSGFRGEGLASIAAVAKVTIVSRTAGADVATALDAHADELGEPRPVAGPPGTRVAVRELFGNVPVRREYLRSPSAEFARIASWLATLALAYPHVGFTLEHDGKASFAFAPGDDLAPRLRHVFGTSSSTMIPLRAGDAHAGVSGWVSSPDDDRPDRRSQVLFVNGRLLRSTLVSGAWSAAYRTFAMVGRYPYGVLYLTVPPHEVDPNVHPTKSDVRLRHGDRVLAAVRDAIGTALRRGAAERLQRSISFAPPQRELAARIGADRLGRHVRAGDQRRERGEEDAARARAGRPHVHPRDATATPSCSIDQHAAHERIVFEQLAANARAHAAAEPLLIPYTFEVRPEEADKLDAALDALAAGGLHVEPFGERAYRVTATPARLVHAGRTRPFDVAEFVDVPRRRRARARCGPARVGVAGVSFRGARARDAGVSRDDRARPAAAALREPDALPARAADDRAAGARAHRGALQTGVTPGVLILTGQTASGKSALALELAERFDAEIVGADSRQIYRGMPIGTAAPSGDDRARVRHHLVEFLDPRERYSAARFVADALAAIDDAHARGKRAIVAGGTGFYVRALAGDVTLSPAYDAHVRERLAREARVHPPDVLAAWLRALAPERAAAIAANDPYRIVRALEVALVERGRAA